MPAATVVVVAARVVVVSCSVVAAVSSSRSLDDANPLSCVFGVVMTGAPAVTSWASTPHPESVASKTMMLAPTTTRDLVTVSIL